MATAYTSDRDVPWGRGSLKLYDYDKESRIAAQSRFRELLSDVTRIIIINLAALCSFQNVISMRVRA